MNNEELALIKLIKNNTSGYADYHEFSLFVYCRSDIFIKIDINCAETIEEILEIIYDEDFDEIEIALEDLYSHDHLLPNISIDTLSINIPIMDKGILNLFDIFRLFNQYFSFIPNISYGLGYESLKYNDPFDICYDKFSEYDGYTYEINLEKKHYENYDFFQDVLSLKSKRNNSFINKYYELINYEGMAKFLNQYNIELDSIKVLTLQTKVRRLAYMKMILNLFHKSNYFPDNIFNKKVEVESTRHKEDLLNYINSKGIVEITKTGNSSKPYIDTLIDLKLIYAQNNRFQLSKYGKIFNVLMYKLDCKSNNYFNLSEYEKTFFLSFIIQRDNFYIWSLIDLIYIFNNRTTIKNIKEIFQQYIIQQLQATLKYSKLSNKNIQKIITQIKRIQSWKKPQVYLEHIIEPRINWLLDLSILDKSEFLKDRIVLSEKGLILFNTLNSYYDMFQEKYAIMTEIINRDFFNLVNEMYSIDAINVNDADLVLIEEYIDESFYLFKTIAPNRVTASQAILYTCFMMLLKEKKIVNFCEIKHFLSSKKNTKFIFDWYKTENDGSIRKRSS